MVPMTSPGALLDPRLRRQQRRLDAGLGGSEAQPLGAAGVAVALDTGDPGAAACDLAAGGVG